MQTIQVAVQIKWLSGKQVGKTTIHEVSVFNVPVAACEVIAEHIQGHLEFLYPVGSRHSAPKVGQFTVVSH